MVDHLVRGGPVVRVLGVPVVDPAGEDIVARVGAPVADQLGEVLPHLQGGPARLREFVLAGEQLLGVRLPVGEMQDARDVFLGDGEPLADRADREQFGDGADEVGLPVGAQPVLQVVQQARGQRGDPGAQGLQGGAVEGVTQGPSLTGVRRGLIRDRVPVNSWVASSCQRLGSGCLSCHAKSGTSQSLLRRTWLHASKLVTK
ncbi:hypothetical protein SHKM778_42700 [Streptomyces sp. KM77-8]|uniref:Uncharacterized protein n=1 Tax=Streptomyces haneummycinicus TaxID=3074435 RepID=A0AAT9HKB9_9ACTN